MAKRMGKGLVALSSAAIAAVYGVGYVVTQPAAVSMAAGTADAPSSAPASTAASPNPASASPASTAQASASPSASASPAAASNGLKDGTFSGTGWSRHGSVSVSVTIQGGKIVSAPITSVTTRYSQSVIAGLPAKVVAAQSASVNAVSGATDSSTAYRSAVAQALAQAGGSAASSTGSVQVTGPSGVIYQNPGSGATTAPSTGQDDGSRFDQRPGSTRNPNGQLPGRGRRGNFGARFGD